MEKGVLKRGLLVLRFDLIVFAVDLNGDRMKSGGMRRKGPYLFFLHVAVVLIDSPTLWVVSEGSL